MIKKACDGFPLAFFSHQNNLHAVRALSIRFVRSISGAPQIRCAKPGERGRDLSRHALELCMLANVPYNVPANILDSCKFFTEQKLMLASYLFFLVVCLRSLSERAWWPQPELCHNVSHQSVLA